jgi:hypothetical protein
MSFDPKANPNGGELPHPVKVTEHIYILNTVEVVANIFSKIEEKRGYPVYAVKLIKDHFSNQPAMEEWIRECVRRQEGIHLYELDGRILFDIKEIDGERRFRVFYLMKDRRHEWKENGSS